MNNTNSSIKSSTLGLRGDEFICFRGKQIYWMLNLKMSISTFTIWCAMKKILSIFAGAIICAICLPAYAFDITVAIDQIKNKKGIMSVALYDSEDNYKNRKSFSGAQAPVTDTALEVTFKNVPAGTYAVRLFQDENENGDLDTGMFGIPTEGYGFSNNVGSFGPASFQDAKFEVSENKKILVHLK